jgi:hypothetical protein
MSFQIQSDLEFIDVQQWSMSDQYGKPSITYNFAPGPWKNEVESRISDLEQMVQALVQENEELRAFRESHPAVKDAWDKYQETVNLTR